MTDSDAAPRTFHKLCGAKPELALFRISPDTHGLPRKSDYMPLSDKKAEDIAKYVSNSIGSPINIRRPMDKTKLFLFLTIVGICFTAYRFASNIEFFKSSMNVC